MSDFTKGAIVRRLESDSIIRSILALDPSPHAGGRPAIFNSWKVSAPNALPQIDFHQGMEMDDDLVDQSKGTQGVWTETWHFQSWAKSRNDVPQQLSGHIKRLFHNQRFALDGGAVLLGCHRIGGDPEGFDAQLDESFAVDIYQIKYSA